jgi:hypothetical protein
MLAVCTSHRHVKPHLSCTVSAHSYPSLYSDPPERFVEDECLRSHPSLSPRSLLFFSLCWSRCLMNPRTTCCMTICLKILVASIPAPQSAGGFDELEDSARILRSRLLFFLACSALLSRAKGDDNGLADVLSAILLFSSWILCNKHVRGACRTIPTCET